MNPSDFSRVPPYSEEAEKAVLALMMTHADELAPMARLEFGINHLSFYYPAHQHIAEAILQLLDDPKGRVDPILLSNKLKETDRLEECGGVEYLMGLTNNSPIRSHAEHYMAVLQNLALRRSGIDTLQTLIDEAFIVEDGREFLLSAPSKIIEVLPDRRNSESTAELADDAIDHWKRVAAGDRSLLGLSTGYAKLDKITSGLQPGLNILAGRPSAGKTSMEGCIATYNAKNGIAVGRIANDMSKRMVIVRDICREAGVSLAKLNNGFGFDKDQAKIEAARNRVTEWPMYIEAGMYDVRQICTWARMMKAKYDIQLLTIDYIQKCRCPWLGPRAQEHDVVTEAAEMLKALAFELNIPVLALAQFNREGERNGSRRPQLSDLRGSGSLEQEASLALFLYKAAPGEYEYPEDGGLTEKQRRAVWCEVAKQQNGEIARFEFFLRGPYFKFQPAGDDWIAPEVDPDKEIEDNAPFLTDEEIDL